MKALSTFSLLLFISAQVHSQTPVALRSDISITHVLKVNTEVTRLAFNRIDSSYYYSTANGNIYKVIMPGAGQAYDTLIYTAADHGIAYVQGMTFYDSCLYVSGNNDINTPLTTGVIRRGKLLAGYSRQWAYVAQTVPYPTAGWYDHLFSGLTTNPTGDTLFICSGSRGDHGEVQTNGGIYPGLRNPPLTSIILRIPAAATGLLIPNSTASLNSMGLVFCTGIRNTYDFAYNGAGDLFGCENSCDRDMEDELNYLQQGKNYGFPWMMGGSYNPQQFPSFDPLADSLINRNAWALTIGAFHNDPSFPQKPAGLQLTLPCLNHGPDAAFMRDSSTGKTYNAAAAGKPVYSFTPHRSPLGLSFDKDSVLANDFRGAGFVLSYTRGNRSLPDSSALLIPFNDSGEDLLMLVMKKDSANDTYSFHAYKIADRFDRPVDAVLHDTSMYIIESDYSGQQSLWRIDFPRHKQAASRIYASRPGSNVSVYPNPANSILNVSMNNSEHKNAALSIFDPSGRLVFTKAINNSQRITINTTSFIPGTYHWRLAGNDGNSSGAFVVVHP